MTLVASRRVAVSEAIYRKSRASRAGMNSIGPGASKFIESAARENLERL